MVLYIRQLAEKCYKMHAIAQLHGCRAPPPSLKTAQQRLLKPLSCCRQPLRYCRLQRAVSRHSAEIGCYNSGSGCAAWHTQSLPYADTRRCWPEAAPDCCMVWSAAARHRRGNQPVAWTAVCLCESWRATFWTFVLIILTVFFRITV